MRIKIKLLVAIALSRLQLFIGNVNTPLLESLAEDMRKNA